MRLPLWLALGFVAGSVGFADEPVVKKDGGVDYSISGVLGKEDARDKLWGCPSKLHVVRLHQGKPYVFDASSETFQAFLRVENSLGQHIAQGNNGAGKNSRLRFTAPKDDTYLVYVASPNGGVGPYTLEVKDFVPTPMKLVPMPAIEKGVSQIQATLDVKDPPSDFRDYPSKFYALDLTAKKTYQFDLTGKFDTWLILLDPNGLMIAQDDDSGGNLMSRIRFTPPTTGRYRLIATTFNGNIGNFTLKATEQP